MTGRSCGTLRALRFFVTGASESLEAAAVEVTDLRRVGKRRLLRDLLKVVNDDWENTAAMLAYIGEIDRRKLYLEDAYSSMFMMCTKHFGMSEAIAAKRIRAGRAACRFPIILAMIRRGELHLSGVHQLAGHLTEKNHEEVLQRAKHRSMREIEALIAEISPQPDRESILRELASEPADAMAGESDVAGRAVESGPIPANSLRSLTVPLSPRRYRLHVTIGQEAKDALEELRALLSHQIPNGDPAQVVEKALALLLAKTKKKRGASTDRPRTKMKKSNKRTRTIPAHVRRAVFARDDGRCAFVDAEGRRCGSNWQVELHHCVPYGRNGQHSEENLQLRCRAHNQFEAEVELGKAFMAKRRKSA
jgi:5-methylcytosine-specific restriction endonuclease McrA